MLDEMPEATETILIAILMSMELGISIPAVFDFQIADTGASNYSSPYNKSCMKMIAETGSNKHNI